MSETILKHATPPSPWPQAGTYFVVRTRGLVPWIIRAATRSHFDHAGIVVSSTGDIVEAEPGGVRRGHLDEYAGCRIAVNSGEDATVEQQAAVVTAATGMIGTPYNDLGIIDDGLESLGWHWRKLAAWAGNDGELICSQAVTLAGHKAGLDWRCGQAQYSEVTPAMLARRPGMRGWTVPAEPGRKP